MCFVDGAQTPISVIVGIRTETERTIYKQKRVVMEKSVRKEVLFNQNPTPDRVKLFSVVVLSQGVGNN